jgi:hypothetical protein
MGSMRGSIHVHKADGVPADGAVRKPDLFADRACLSSYADAGLLKLLCLRQASAFEGCKIIATPMRDWADLDRPRTFEGRYGQRPFSAALDEGAMG